jgi:hypothetical protein
MVFDVSIQTVVMFKCRSRRSVAEETPPYIIPIIGIGIGHMHDSKYMRLDNQLTHKANKNIEINKHVRIKRQRYTACDADYRRV